MEKITKLYGGKVELKFLGPTDENPYRHMYYVAGKRKSGVTTFLGIKDKSKGLTAWTRDTIGQHLLDKIAGKKKVTAEDVLEAMAQPEIFKQRAADLGTRIHDWCERYIKHKLGREGFKTMPDMPEEKEVQMGAAAFLQWEAEHKVKFEESEQLIFSKKHDYVGQLDIRARVDGKLCLIDLKSSNGLYNEVRMQTAAYVMADQEESGRKYAARWALRLSKNTEAEYMAKEELKKALKRAKAQYEKKAFADYDIPKWQIFEAKPLDELGDGSELKRDFEAFTHAQFLYRWNNETDFWKTNRK